MKSEYKLFGLVSGFLFLAAAVYAWWTYVDARPHRIEWIGTVALILSGLLCLMCGGYFWFVSRRIDPRPEDRLDADIAEGAGELGFFSPGSYWPVGIAFAAMVAGLGLAFSEYWLLAIGLIGVLFAVGGLLFEYYIGGRNTLG